MVWLCLRLSLHHPMLLLVTSYATEFDNLESDFEEFQISKVFLLG